MGVVTDRVALERQQIPDDEVDLVVLNQLAHLGERHFGLGLGVLDDEVDLEPAELSALLLEIKLETLDHLLGAFGHETRKRHRQANAQLLRKARPGIAGQYHQGHDGQE